MPQIQKLNFTILYTTLAETLPEFLEANLLCTFRQGVVWIFSPIWSHINENETKIFKNPKFEISPIVTHLGQRASLEVCMNLWKWICYVLSEEMSFEFFLPYGPMLTKTNNNRKKIKHAKCWKKIGLEMWRKVRFHQIWHLSAWRVPRKRVLRKTDARVTTIALLYSSTQQR